MSHYSTCACLDCVYLVQQHEENRKAAIARKRARKKKQKEKKKYATGRACIHERFDYIQ